MLKRNISYTFIMNPNYCIIVLMYWHNIHKSNSRTTVHAGKKYWYGKSPELVTKRNVTDWWKIWLTGDLKSTWKKLNDWLATCHNMTGGGSVMTTSASMGVIYSAPRPPSWIWGDGKGKGEGIMGKKTKGDKGSGGRGKEKGREEKRKGEGRDGTLKVF